MWLERKAIFIWDFYPKLKSLMPLVTSPLSDNVQYWWSNLASVQYHNNQKHDKCMHWISWRMWVVYDESVLLEIAIALQYVKPIKCLSDLMIKVCWESWRAAGDLGAAGGGGGGRGMACRREEEDEQEEEQHGTINSWDTLHLYLCLYLYLYLYLYPYLYLYLCLYPRRQEHGLQEGGGCCSINSCCCPVTNSCNPHPCPSVSGSFYWREVLFRWNKKVLFVERNTFSSLENFPVEKSPTPSIFLPHGSNFSTCDTFFWNKIHLLWKKLFCVLNTFSSR